MQEHLQAFINTYNFAKRLKTLHGLTPWEFILKSWNLCPELFKTKPNSYNLELNTMKKNHPVGNGSLPMYGYKIKTEVQVYF